MFSGGMWSQVQATGTGGCPAPSSRSKHAMCVAQSGLVYLLGGRSANLPLKDLWKFDPVQSVWEEMRCRGNRPPCLQEHTIVYWKNTLYVFGGEIGFASTGETPLWILDLNGNAWRKHHVRHASVHQPSGRRGHSTVVYGGDMHMFGGYQDLRGSSSELWTFDFTSERWSLLMTPSYFEQPPPRHNHSCVVHDGAMWIYGGLTDLQARADFWKWDFAGHRWSRVKTQKGPGELHGHSAVKAMAFMYIFGGERSGVALNELWRFHFATEIWERINADGVIPPPRCRHVAVPNPALYDWETKVSAWGENNPDEKVPDRANPPKSISMCFGQNNAEPENGKKHFKFKVHPVSRFCSKNTSSDEDDDEEYTVSYSQTAAQVNLRTLKDKFHSSRLVRSISSGSYSILHNQSNIDSRRDELEKLVEESTPHQQHRPRLKIQKSQSSDAVLESDSESATPQHKPNDQSKHIPVDVRDSPPLWVENPNTLLRSSWSESTFQRNYPAGSNRSSTTAEQHHNNCTTPTTSRLGRLAYEGLLSTVRDVEEETSENADEPNMMISTQNNATKHVANNGEKTVLLVDLDIPTVEPDRQNGSHRFTSSHTISDFASQIYTPSIESRELPHSISHSSGYHSFTEEENGFDHREYAGCLNSSASRKIMLRGRDLELKTFLPSGQPHNHQDHNNGVMIIPPPPHYKERARSLDRTSSQRKLVRSYPSGGSITPTILMSTSIVEDSFRSGPRIPRIESFVTSPKDLDESPNRRWSRSPAKLKPIQHQWQLCLYMFGGREQGAPGVYRQPISVWKLYM